MAEPDSPPIPEEGSLESTSVPRLLAAAWRDRRTGSLHLAHGQSVRRIDMRDGAPIGVESSQGEDDFAGQLADAGRISANDRLAVERLASERRCPQAKAVLALKLLDAKTLYHAMREQARRRIAETFAWSAGVYRWTPCEAAPDGGARPHDMLRLLQDELPRRWGTDRLFQSLLEVQETTGDIAPRFRRVASRLAETGAPAGRAISLLDGSRPLGAVLGECAGDPLAAATLWTALYTGILRTRDARPRRTAETALDLDLEIVVDTPATAPSAGAANETRRSGSPKATAQSDGLREEIERLHPRLESLDHYEALGLDASANATAIKKAYFQAAKKYHPDALARMGLSDLKETAATVFARIAEAFETLSDPDKRRAYDSGASEEPEIDMARLAQAETSFRKGEVLAKMGNFNGALEYLEPAVELWPDEPAYQGLLGWALFKQPRPDLERAIEHLEIAMAQAPDDAVLHLRLGRVLRAAGDTGRADELAARARKIDPAVRE